MSEKLTVVTEKMNNLNRRTIAIILAVALVLSVFAGTGWFAVTKAEDLKPEYPDLSNEEILEYYDEDLTSLSQADVVYFTNNFLSVFEYSERALITDFLEGKGITHALEYSDSKWKQAEEVLDLVQRKWRGFTDLVPTELKIDIWKSAEGNVNQIFNYISVSIDFFKNLDYARNWDDDVFEQTYHRLKAYRTVVGVISSKIKTPIALFVSTVVEKTLSILEDTYYIAAYLHECYKKESLEVYKADCALAYASHSDFPEPEGVNDDEKKGKSTIYIEFQLRRMFDDYKNSTTVGESGEICHFGGHSYQLVEQPLTWDKAKIWCEEQGGHLATITSAEEQEAINSFLKLGKKENYFIGGREKTEGVWYWVTGEEFSYSNWRSGEPNNSCGGEDTLMTYSLIGEYGRRGLGWWNDTRTDAGGPSDGHYGLDRFGFVCEWDEYVEAFPTINDEHHFIEYVNEFCEKDGYTEHVCEDCGLKYYSDHTEPTGHDYVFSETVVPTCTAQGYDLYICTHCNNTEKKNVVAALGHDYQITRHVDETCTSQGYDLCTCSRCKSTTKNNIVNATGHSYTSQVAKEATCTEEGIRVKTCEACGDSYEETISKLGHNFTWASNTHIAPTCTAKGYTVQTCSRCGETQQVNELPAMGHDYGDVLGAAHIATIYDANHRFKDSLAYTPNTVTANTIGSTPIGSDSLFEAAWMTLPREIHLSENDLGAVEEYYLSRQRQPLFFHSMGTTIPAAFAYDASTGRAPEESALPYTDGEGNLYVVDGETMIVSLPKEEASEKGILNDDGTVNVKTAISEGYDLAYSAGLPGTYIILPEMEFESMLSGWNTPTSIFHYDGKGTASPGVYTVNYCFYNEKRSGLAGTTIKVYDTDALNYKTPATSETPAQLHHRCIDCGEEMVEDITNNGELNIRASSLSLGNNLIMNFKVSKNTLEGFDAPYVEVIRNGKTTRITSLKEQGDDYVFSFENIAPQTMNDELSATLYATKEGVLYGSNTLKTSVKSYVKFLLDTYSADKYARLRTLVIDLLNYGAEAQEYRNYKTNDLVNAGLTSEQKSWASGGDLSLSDVTDASYQTVETPAANWSSVALILDNSVTVRYKFTANDINGMSIKVQYGNTEKEFDSSCFDSLGDSTYSFKFGELSAHQMQVPLYATIYKDGEAVSNTFAYSVESYAARVRQSQPDTALGKLTDALMRYGFSATNYKNS